MGRWGHPLILANGSDYERCRGGLTEVNYWRLSVLVTRWSSLNFESKTVFHGLATPSGGRHTVEDDDNVLPPGDGNKKLSLWSHWILPPYNLPANLRPPLWPQPAIGPVLSLDSPSYDPETSRLSD